MAGRSLCTVHAVRESPLTFGSVEKTTGSLALGLGRHFLTVFVPLPSVQIPKTLGIGSEQSLRWRIHVERALSDPRHYGAVM